MVTFYGPLRTGRVYARNLVSDDSVRRNGAGAWLCRRRGVGTSQHGTGSRPSRRTTLMSLLKLQMRRSLSGATTSHQRPAGIARNRGHLFLHGFPLPTAAVQITRRVCSVSGGTDEQSCLAKK